MPPTRNRIFWTVFWTHTGIILLLFIVPLFRGCFREKPKEAVIFVAPATAPAVTEAILPSIKPDPNPEPAPEPTPEPEPAPEPDPTPNPTPKPEKPKWKPKKVVRQNKRVTRQTTTPPPRPVQRVRADQIQKALDSAATSHADQHLLYCSRIQPKFDAVWRQPTAAAYGTRASATIRVHASGRVTYRRLTARSGNAAFDRSVENALNAINRLPAPPDVSVNRDIIVDFILD